MNIFLKFFHKIWNLRHFWDKIAIKIRLYIDNKTKKCYNFFNVKKYGQGVFMINKETVKKIKHEMLLTKEDFTKLLDVFLHL